MKRLFTTSELKNIESAVTSAEKKTSGEIVTMVVPASSDYRWVTWFWAGIGMGVATAGLAAYELRTGFAIPLTELVEVQLFGAAVGGLLAFWLPFKRLVLTPKQTAWRVHREALANFTATGLHETRDRTGILIYISELERRVQILADSGIHGHAGEPYWKEMVTEIVAGIRGGRASASLCETIEKIGDKLATHFPPRPDDTDELSNAVRTGPADMGN